MKPNNLSGQEFFVGASLLAKEVREQARSYIKKLTNSSSGIKKIIPSLLLLTLSHLALAASLPSNVAEALKRAKIPLSSIGIVVKETNASKTILDINGSQAMNPASTMKLLTTFSALEILGPAYRWKTEAYLDGKLENGVLQGNLVFKGYGDPKLTVDQFWMWLRELRQRGLREIRGNIVLDQSFFEPVKNDPAEFDNDPSRAYNVTPNALLLNFNALHLHLIPNGNVATALLEPELVGYTVKNLITTSSKLACGGEDAYSSHLAGHIIMLEGSIPAGCGETDDYFSLLPHDEYFFALFSALWKELGGTIQGKLIIGSAPINQVPFATHKSQALSETIRDINKFSNNTMARQLFLTLGASETLPANTTRSTAVIQQWLDSERMNFPELVLENGAGLSRKESITARHMAEILQRATRSRYAAELEASLPILGMDGTVKKRFKESPLSGYAHLKTGTLDGVKSIAGYVKARSGKQYILVFIVNHANAALTQPAQDALIEWLYNTY
ncbi:MAG: D-alanyl-D-alanine carboxypeptidase/D-alanyl-D-alanine-endopeptidase [Gallionella sp.]|nr:D-alanyl-D-alanine carboxypeptidase/D-alanyl-D-alanine-endopeptidase [Gallionella sp.]